MFIFSWIKRHVAKTTHAMNWKFLKTNWFTISLVLLMLMAVARRYAPAIGSGVTSPKKHERPEANPEKYTATDNQALLDFSSEQGTGAALPDKAAVVAFIRRFESVSVSERKKFGIPSSVLLGCALVNSSAGQAGWIDGSNNYFALGCGSDWEGPKSTSGGRCLRQYESAWASFRDFSIFLTSQDWYGGVKKSAGKDWQKWVGALDGKGVSEVPDFSAALERAIRTYRLYDLDEM